MDNLLSAWKEFIVGKKSKIDVQKFSSSLMDNILQLHDDLANGSYQHGGYESFYVVDPKLRHIHKASVRDRLVHHAVFRQLYPFFAKTFIADSYSCQNNKGTLKAVNKFRTMFRQVSRNNTKTCWVLKCDIRKFFDSIDHKILKEILSEYIFDGNIKWLLAEIIESFEVSRGKGLPLGNLTSQLFANVYMNKFDQFVKHKIKAVYYIRYADDFIVLSDNRQELSDKLILMERFLDNQLNLKMHPQKVFIQTIASGVDFLGWVNFPHHRILRTKIKRRMIKRLESEYSAESLASYSGLMKHGNAFELSQKMLNSCWFWGK